MKTKPAAPLRTAIAGILAPLGQGWRLVETGVLANWSRIVGPQIAGRSFPCQLKGGVLTVGVTGSAWMNQLHFFREEMARKINEHAGELLVREIRLVLRKNPAAPRIPSGGPSPPRRLSPAELAEIDAACRSIADPELREVVRRFLGKQAAYSPGGKEKGAADGGP